MTLVPHSGKSSRSRRPSLFQAGVERRFRNRVQHADRRLRDAGRNEELVLPIEDSLVVVIEADDHAAPDVEPCVLDRVQAVEERRSLADVLQFLRFA